MMKTNIEHRTLNIEFRKRLQILRRSMLDVGCSMFTIMTVSIFLTGCGNRTSSSLHPVDQAIEESILIRGNGAEPESLDPHLATSVSAGNILINLYEGLTRLNPETLEAEPGMAERWDIAEDGLTWTFFLREAQWSNGEPVTAGDFDFAFRRLLNPELGASYAFMLYPIRNAEAVNKGEAPSDELGIRVLDDRTLELTLEKPMPPFAAMLAHWTAFPLPQILVEEAGAASRRDVGWMRPETFVGNGAFRLKEWQDEERITLEKNPNYWQADSVSLEGAVFIPFTDPGAEERAFRSGEIHLSYTLPRHRLNQYRENNPEVLRVDPYLESAVYAVNLSHPALQDVRVRKALSLALDRRAITQSVLYGVRKPAFHYVPPGIPGYTSAPSIQENEEQARTLLAEAGYGGGEGMPRIGLMYPSGQDAQRVAEVIQQQWLQVLGIRIDIENVERRTYFSRRRERNFDLCVFAWVGDYVDPKTYLGLWVTGAGNNLAGWSNAEYDRLIHAAAFAGDERAERLAQAEQILLEDLPVIPLYFGATQYLKDPRVKGWHANVLDLHPLRAVSFAP
jgi:oligopeptide transport system substrate-binding protein